MFTEMQGSTSDFGTDYTEWVQSGRDHGRGRVGATLQCQTHTGLPGGPGKKEAFLANGGSPLQLGAEGWRTEGERYSRPSALQMCAVVMGWVYTLSKAASSSRATCSAGSMTDLAPMPRKPPVFVSATVRATSTRKRL